MWKDTRVGLDLVVLAERLGALSRSTSLTGSHCRKAVRDDCRKAVWDNEGEMCESFDSFNKSFPCQAAAGYLKR
jgi:hypothetical protein